MTHNMLARARDLGTPLVSSDTATFVWFGGCAPQLIADFTNWEWGDPLALAQREEGVWAREVTLPADSYVEYTFWRDGRRVADPLNPHTVPNGVGARNHVFCMPEWKATSLVQRRRAGHRGRLSHHQIDHDFYLGSGKRKVLLYRPECETPCPLLVVLDGQDYRARGKIVNIVDNLISDGRIGPVAMALPYHGGRHRVTEYSCSELHLSFLVNCVLALAKRHLNLIDETKEPGVHGILGASMGGLMATYAGLRLPDVFGHVLSQSGAFTLDGRDTVVWDLVRHGPIRPVRFWMDAGHFEWLLEPNRRFQQHLLSHDYDATYREFHAGHNYTAWSNDVWRGLESLFGPGRTQGAEE